MSGKYRLKAFMARARQQLIEVGLGKHRRQAINLKWRSLEYFAEINQRKNYAPSLGVEFKEYMCGRNLTENDRLLSPCEQTIRHAVRLLDYLYCNGTILKNLHGGILLLPAPYRCLADRYLIHRSTMIKHSSWLVARRHLVNFLKFLEIKSVRRLRDITPTHISEYCQTLAGYDNCTIHTYLCDLRSFLGFLHEYGHHSKDLRLFIPKYRLYQEAHLPSTWTPEEIRLLLDSVERENPVGKRDYAMLLLIATLGLRISDVIALHLENLNWKDRQIEFIQKKDETRQCLPLTEEVGAAIIDYLKNGRPETDSRHVFIRHLSPYTHFSEHNSCWVIFLHYLKKAGLSRKKRVGMHSLRHSFASNMLKQKIPVPVISTVLGHAHLRTTIGYLKIDIDQLRRCCLSYSGTEAKR